MLEEFKEFAVRGNLLDLAIGIILGTAFGKIITSFVNDVLMPPIGLLLGNVDSSGLFINLSPSTSYPSLAAAKAAGAPVIAYGMFINSVIDFLIVALVMFLIVRQVNRFHRAAPEEKTTRDCPYCTSEISIKAKRCPHCTSELA